MTECLITKTCTPCQGGGVPRSRAARPNRCARRRRTGRWRTRAAASSGAFTFRIREALAFVDKVGALAESEGHHPDVQFGWGYATISLQTKKIMGLHENDFIMAAKIDRIAGA